MIVQVMRGIEPFLQEALQRVQRLKEQEQACNKTLEATIDTHRGDLSRRRADAADASPLPPRTQGERAQMTSALPFHEFDQPSHSSASYAYAGVTLLYAIIAFLEAL